MNSGQYRGPEVVLAVDVGGTTVKGSVFVDGVEIPPEHTVPTFEGSSGAFDAVLAVLSAIAGAARALGHEPTAIGAGSPGLVDTSAGLVRYAANLHWTNLPLVSLLEARFGIPTVVDHDARTAARAEMAQRPALRNFVFIPIGTGISAAVVIEGKIVTGARGQAGELGHIPIVPDGLPCSCGQTGCLESYASASAVLKRYLAAGGSAVSAAEVSAMVGNDTLAAEVWTDAVHALAGAITTLTATLDSDKFIIGGGLAAAGPALLNPLREKVADLMGWREPPSIDTARAGPRAGLLGAAILGSAAHRTSTNTNPEDP